jgi:magnesium-transporting ATPase (P-type)
MAKAFDFKRMRRVIMIYGVVQLFLVGLLVYMAVHFQSGLLSEGRPQRFLHSVVATLVIQLALFYPINRFAAKEAEREVEACAVGLGIEELKALRSKRMVGDVIKAAIFLFFITFIYKAPKDLFVLSLIFFSFILTFLSYFQCYNFSAKRLMKEKS